MGGTARAALWLTGGRTVGFAVAFVIPLILSRYLTQEEFGTYKYLFLVVTTLGFMQWGMAESLYYFVPGAPARAGRAVANALGALAISGAVVIVLLAAAAAPAAGWMSGGAVPQYLPALGVFLALMLLSTPLEIVMVSRQQPRLAAVTYAGSDILRTALLVAPVVFVRDLNALMDGAIVFAFARCVWLAVYLRREFGRGLRFDRGIWSAQWRYAVPFTLAVVVELVQFNLHQYVVAAWFGPAVFAVYAVGCMQIPLVDLLATSTANVMMVRMKAESDPAEVRRIWHAAVARLASVFVPLAVGLALTAQQVIGVLYPASYLPAAGILVVATALVALAALPVDGVLRVYAQTRFLIVMNLVRLVVIVSGIGLAVTTFQLRGAIGITVAAQLAAKVLAVRRIAALLECRLGQALPWRALAATSVAAAAGVAPAVWVREALVTQPFVVQGGATAVSYLAGYAATAWMLAAADRRGAFRRVRLGDGVAAR